MLIGKLRAVGDRIIGIIEIIQRLGWLPGLRLGSLHGIGGCWYTFLARMNAFARAVGGVEVVPMKEAAQMLLFETARLCVRQLEDGDADDLFAICRDPVAMQWMGDGQPLTFEQCQRWIAVSQRNYATHGFGASAVELRAAPGLIGFCGLVFAAGSSTPEIIYGFGRRWWGQSYASEVVPAMLRYGIETCRLARILATIDPQNLASCRVVEKAGMRFEGLEPEPEGQAIRVYAIERQGLSI